MDFTALFSRTSFSTYDEGLAFTLRCPGCGGTHDVQAAWSELADGFGGDEAAAVHARAPFLLRARLPLTCAHCGAALTVYFLGAAGGRQGEIQYAIAGLRHAGQTMV